MVRRQASGSFSTASFAPAALSPQASGDEKSLLRSASQLEEQLSAWGEAQEARLAAVADAGVPAAALNPPPERPPPSWGTPAARGRTDAAERDMSNAPSKPELAAARRENAARANPKPDAALLLGHVRRGGTGPAASLRATKPRASIKSGNKSGKASSSIAGDKDTDGGIAMVAPASTLHKVASSQPAKLDVDASASAPDARPAQRRKADGKGQVLGASSAAVRLGGCGDQHGRHRGGMAILTDAALERSRSKLEEALGSLSHDLRPRGATGQQDKHAAAEMRRRQNQRQRSNTQLPQARHKQQQQHLAELLRETARLEAPPHATGRAAALMLPSLPPPQRKAVGFDVPDTGSGEKQPRHSLPERMREAALRVNRLDAVTPGSIECWPSRTPMLFFTPGDGTKIKVALGGAPAGADGGRQDGGGRAASNATGPQADAGPLPGVAATPTSTSSAPAPLPSVTTSDHSAVLGLDAARGRGPRPRFLIQLEDYLDSELRLAGYGGLGKYREVALSVSTATQAPTKDADAVTAGSGSAAAGGGNSGAVYDDVYAAASTAVSTSSLRPDLCRLEIFRVAFQHVIDSFKTYGPVLALVKLEYEAVANAYAADRELVAALRGHAESIDLALASERLQNKQRLDEQTREFDKHVEVQRKQQERLAARSARLTDQLQSLRNERHELVAELECSKKREDDLGAESESRRVQVIDLQQEVRELNARLREQEAELQRKAKLARNMSRTVRQQDNMLRKRQQRLNSLVGHHSELQTLLETEQGTASNLAAHASQQEELVRAMTPRPEWEAALQDAGLALRPLEGEGGDEGDDEAGPGATPAPSLAMTLDGREEELKELADGGAIFTALRSHAPSGQLTQMLTSLVGEQAKRIAKMERMLPKPRARQGAGPGSANASNPKAKATAKASSDAPWQKPFFVGIGVGAGVPRYLQCKGKVRNRNLSKRETELFIKDVWRAKAKAKNCEPLAAYFFSYLKGKFGIQATIAEWGYNVVHSLERYIEDPDLELFYAVMTGQVTEEVYTEQMAMLDSLTGVFESADRLGGGRLRHTINKHDFKVAVAEFYCDKPTGELQELWAALEEEQDGPSVNYVRLFEEDRDLNQGTFATLLRQQHLATRRAYISKIEEALLANCGGVGASDGLEGLANAAEDGVPHAHSNDRAGHRAVTIEQARRALLNVDPSKEDDDLNAMIGRGCGCTYDELLERRTEHIACTGSPMRIPVDTFVRELQKSTGVIHSSKREQTRAMRAVQAVAAAQRDSEVAESARRRNSLSSNATQPAGSAFLGRLMEDISAEKDKDKDTGTERVFNPSAVRRLSIQGLDQLRARRMSIAPGQATIAEGDDDVKEAPGSGVSLHPKPEEADLEGEDRRPSLPAVPEVSHWGESAEESLFGLARPGGRGEDDALLSPAAGGRFNFLPVGGAGSRAHRPSFLTMNANEAEAYERLLAETREGAGTGGGSGDEASSEDASQALNYENVRGGFDPKRFDLEERREAVRAAIGGSASVMI